MLKPLQLILPDLRASLGGAPLYTSASQLNRTNPPPPYCLMLPVSQPSDPNAFDAVLVASLNVWGSLWQVSEIADKLEWLDGHYIGSVEGESIQNIRYTRQSRTMGAEPEGYMSDGATELWNLSEVLRVQYAHFPVRVSG